MKIKKLFGNFAAAFLMIFAFGILFPAQAQEKTPQQVTEDFYKWYIGELNADKNPIDDKQTINKYVSKRLVKWLYSKDFEEYGADYFLDAQDWANDWVNNIKAAEGTMKGRVSTLEVTFKTTVEDEAAMGDRSLKIKLINENGAWKIDRVNDQF